MYSRQLEKCGELQPVTSVRKTVIIGRFDCFEVKHENLEHTFTTVVTLSFTEYLVQTD